MYWNYLNNANLYYNAWGYLPNYYQPYIYNYNPYLLNAGHYVWNPIYGYIWEP